MDRVGEQGGRVVDLASRRPGRTGAQDAGGGRAPDRAERGAQRSAEPLPLSNRRGIGLLTAPDGFGVDRLSLSFPVAEEVAARDAWGSVTTLCPGAPNEKMIAQANVATSGTSVMVGMATIEGRLYGKVEVNPARMRDPEGCSVLPLSQLQPYIGVMLEVAGDYLRPACAAGDVKVRRLDLARDFRGVSSPSFYVAGLLPVHRPYAKRVGVWSDAAKGSAQTLHAGSGAGMVRLYDQFEAYGESKGAPIGALRWEVEARRDWLGRLGNIETVQQLSIENMLALANDRWEWSAMGVEVRGTDAVVERVMAAVVAGHMSERESDAFLGWLLKRARGQARPLAKNTATKYRRWVRDLGITLSAEDLTAGGGGVVGRLDWDSGTEVLQVA